VRGSRHPDSRIVVQLEQRQIFFVLMGILAMASGILVLGYMLGLRVGAPAALEARAQAAPKDARRAAVDVSDAARKRVELTFHERIMSPTGQAQPLPEAPTAEEQARRVRRARAAVASAAKAAEARKVEASLVDAVTVAKPLPGKAPQADRSAATAGGPKAGGPKAGDPKAAPPKADPPKALPKKALPKKALPKKALPKKAAVPVRVASTSFPERVGPKSSSRLPAAEARVDEVTSDALSVLKRLRKDRGAPATPSKVASPARRPERRYTVQVGAFQERSDALSLLDKLRGRGHNPFLLSSKVRERGRWYRVRVGRFSDKAKAKEYQRRIETAEGIKGTFVARM